VAGLDLEALLARVLAPLRRLTGAAPVSTDPATAPRNKDLFLYQRLEKAGLDADYIEATDPALVGNLEQSCSRCGYTGRCSRDLDEEDFNDRVAGYCPNTAKIDDMIIKKQTG
jgi:hypothetical protein